MASNQTSYNHTPLHEIKNLSLNGLFLAPFKHDQIKIFSKSKPNGLKSTPHMHASIAPPRLKSDLYLQDANPKIPKISTFMASNQSPHKHTPLSEIKHVNLHGLFSDPFQLYPNPTFHKNLIYIALNQTPFKHASIPQVTN